MTIRLVTVAFALALAFTGCASPQESDLPPLSESQTTRTGEEQAPETADETTRTEQDTQADQAESTDNALPQKETTMADPNAPEDVAAPPADATTTDSGLAYKILEEGQGETPEKTSTVQVHYTGWTTDGKKFDSSHDRGKPAEFPLNRVIAGWTEGVSMMKPGEKRRLWIPEELAYQGRPGAPQGMLVFDVELLKIVK